MTVAVKAAKHAAPGPYLGFALQPVRLCFHLLTCPAGAAVSLEHVDDVAIHYPDGKVTFEQTKSALKQNPLSDWAEDLWKTISNWLDGIQVGEIAADKSHFQLYVTPPRQGPWANELNSAATPNDVAELVDKIKAKYYKLKTSKGCDTYLQRFLAASKAAQVALVTRLTISSGDKDPLDPLRDLIKTAVMPQLVDVLCEAAIGIAKEQADRLIRDGKPAILDGDTFKTDFRAFVQKTNIPGLLISFTSAPGAAEVSAVLSTRPIFIRQLEIIKASQDECVRAISDFLRTSADKSVWAELGLVFADSLSEWDDHLVSRHGLVLGEIADLYPKKSPVLRGRLVYHRCAQLQPPLDGRAVPGHFVHGCFNQLADVLRLGWHPHYLSLLGEEGA